ncbi:MAG: SPOR domain-containing protein [Rickettsiales bacterium]|nr:SPOR domain-containing protein [Rickettsiales bacterium]
MLSLFLFGCAVDDSKQMIRIVDKDGREANMNKIVPEFNEAQLKKQKQVFDKGNMQTTQINRFIQQDINADMVVATPNSEIQYPSDIFADRITNYNYRNANSDSDIIFGNDLEQNISTKEISRPSGGLEVSRNEQNLTKKGGANTKKVEKKESITQKSPLKQQKTSLDDNNVDGFFVQIGIFSNRENANNSFNKFKKVNNGVIREINKKYKVLLGPYPDKEKAEMDKEKVIKMGHYDVFVTKG